MHCKLTHEGRPKLPVRFHVAMAILACIPGGICFYVLHDVETPETSPLLQSPEATRKRLAELESLMGRKPMATERPTNRFGGSKDRLDISYASVDQDTSTVDALTKRLAELEAKLAAMAAVQQVSTLPPSTLRPKDRKSTNDEA